MQQGDPDPTNQPRQETVPVAQPVTDSIDASSVVVPVPSGPDEVAWEASEYLDHHNGFWWYVVYCGVAAILIAFGILFHFWTFVIVVPIAAIAGLIHVNRPPRTIRYILDNEGLVMENRVFPYANYKSFSLIRDGAFFAILLIPTRRFSPSTVVYFDEADGEAIIDALGAYLPMEKRGLDTVDKFLRLIRF